MLDAARLRPLIYSIVISVIGYLVFVLWAGWQDVIAASVRIGMFWLLVALLLSLCNYLLRFIRWHYYLQLLGFRVPLRDDLGIYFSGFALTTTPGKAGELLRGVFLKRYEVEYRASISLFFTERLSDLLAILIFVLLGVTMGLKMQGYLAFLGLFLLALILLLQQQGLFHWFQARLGEAISGWRKLVSHLLDILLHSSRLLQIVPLGAGILLAVVSWGAEGVAFYLLVHQLGLDIGLATALYIYALSMLIGALSFLPGGLGSAELTMVFLLMQQGMQEAEATAVTVLTRFATLWFAVILGAFALSYENRRQVQSS